ncbi:MAG: DUF58 domain-containing protein [Aggregatilineales bacterium]
MARRRNAIHSLIILAFIGGLATGRTFFFNLGYLLLILLILAWLWARLNLSGVRIVRTTRARRTQVGKTLDEYLTLQSRSPLPKLWLEVRDHSSLPDHRVGIVVPPLAPYGAFSWSVHTPCLLRGEFQLGGLTLASGDPFGFFQLTRELPATSSVLVYPAIVPLADFAPEGGVLSGGEAQRQRAYFVTTNAAGIRDYAPGDSFNRIHWRSTARRDRLIVKEFELDPLSELWVLLDLNAAARAARPFDTGGVAPGELYLPPDSAEYAIALAASISAHFLIKERSLGFIAYTPRRNVLQPDRGGRQLTRILEALALAKVEGDLPFAQLIALENHQLTRGAIAILISADMGDDWLAEAQLLVRRGVRVVAVLIDPHSFGVATPARSASETRACLEIGGVTTYLVRYGDNLSAALSRANLRLPSRPSW